MSFYWFDVAGGAILLGFAAISWFRGFIKEAFSALAWFGGYLGAVTFYPDLSKVLQGRIGKPVVSDVLAFIILYVGIYVLVRIISWVVREKLGFNNVPGYLNGPAGGLMGAVKGALFISALLIPLNYFPNAKSEFMEKSYVARLVSGVSELCYPLLRMDTAKAEKVLKEDVSKIKDVPASVAKAVEKAASSAAEEAVKPAKAPKPALKKTEPVVKNKPEGHGGDMDQFVRTLR